MAFNNDEMSKLAQKYNNKKTILAVICGVFLAGCIMMAVSFGLFEVIF